MPKTSKRLWTAEETERLREAIGIWGEKHWKLISEHVGTKDSYACYQHYHRVIHPRISRSRFTTEEYYKLVWLVRTLGRHSWTTVAQRLNASRTDIQVRTKYLEILRGGNNFTRHLKELLEQSDITELEMFLDQEGFSFHRQGNARGGVDQQSASATSSSDVAVVPETPPNSPRNSGVAASVSSSPPDLLPMGRAPLNQYIPTMQPNLLQQRSAMMSHMNRGSFAVPTVTPPISAALAFYRLAAPRYPSISNFSGSFSYSPNKTPKLYVDEEPPSVPPIPTERRPSDVSTTLTSERRESMMSTESTAAAFKTFDHRFSIPSVDFSENADGFRRFSYCLFPNVPLNTDHLLRRLSIANVSLGPDRITNPSSTSADDVMNKAGLL
eukprot:ANDGO_07782.mRNA.1 Myb-like protein A